MTLVALYFVAASAHAASSPIKIDLVSESKAIVPGAPFTVAIRQRMKAGYHTYWRNPGTVGLATSMEWKLPEGFSAGEIQWQLPELTTMAAYTVWGYEKEVLLLVDITPPDSLKPGDKVVLKGDATWMCCGKQCHPGFKELNLELPVAAKAKKDKRLKRAFDKVRSQQPIQSDAWKVECAAKGNGYTLRITPVSEPANKNPGDIRFFDYDRQISSDKPQVLQRDGDSFVLKLKAEEHTPDELEMLKGILVAENGWESEVPGVVMFMSRTIDRTGNGVTGVPASTIKWHAHFGGLNSMPHTVLSLMARGFFQSATADVEATIRKWIETHPDARIVIVSSWGPTLANDPKSRTAYIWIVDGADSLNQELVRRGCIPYQTQILSKAQKLSISDKDYQDFIAKIKETGIAARNAKRGIWSKP